ncbi:helix-turn-helix transcriptional regulator [Geomesophilobacter sediminis]|uniref:Response regulator transcription factor n=1 Tax=Geomesophilobacter sediminis TaxID=2798584 RepID=A0A8J7JEL9_9BACT|nr:response regulator transcription factor [Geomesophilobacter sediminis]MBJ6725721.1 response regulator transcription factor [Geomesophilobacter sediminis]
MRDFHHHILIIGPKMLQNAVLASYIEDHTDWHCIPIEKVELAEQVEKEEPNGIFVLHDAVSLQGKVFEAALAAELERMPVDWAVALFNLERSSDVERSAIRYGIKGIFYEDDTPEVLIKGISAIFHGELWASRKTLAESLIDCSRGLMPHRTLPQFPNGLTKREAEILYLLSEGCSNKGIAKHLFISPETVRTHLHRIFKKLHLSTRLEASLWASRHLFSHS